MIGTDHKYIVRDPEILGGRPSIRDTRVGVHAVVGYLNVGYDVERVLQAMPHLTPAAVYDAISFYFDAREEIDAILEEDWPGSSKPRQKWA